jgi:hypothetical protein
METLADISGLFRQKPGIALVLTVLSFSFLGLPPLSGFWGKFFVFRAALNAGLWQVAVAGLVLSVVAAFFYLRLIKVMWFDAPPEGVVAKEPLEAKTVAIVLGLFSMAGVWLALGDPVGEGEDAISAIWRFRDLCERNRVDPAFWGVGPAYLRIYADIGLTAVPLDEAGGQPRYLLLRAERDLERLDALLPPELRHQVDPTAGRGR